MAKQNEALFEESSQGAVSAITAFILILSLVLVAGGMVLASYAFQPGLDQHVMAFVFAGGLLATVLGFAVPFNLLPGTGK